MKIVKTHQQQMSSGAYRLVQLERDLPRGGEGTMATMQADTMKMPLSHQILTKKGERAGKIEIPRAKMAIHAG